MDEKCHKFHDLLNKYLKEKNISASIDTQNANGDVAVSAQIAQKFKNEKKQIVIVL